MDRQSFIFAVAFTVASIIGVCSTSAKADESIMRAIGPGVVFVKGAEQTGSGIVVREEGVILTNSNIVGSANQVTLHATLTKSGRTTFKRVNASIKGRHPDYPVVLLQADVPEGYQMVRLKSAKTTPEDGQACYAVGCTEGNRSTHKRQFTECELKNAGKLMKGKEYLEVTSTVNPVNNGGAVADKDGQLLGILINQYRGSGYSGIAIGIRSIRPSEFIPENPVTDVTENPEPEPENNDVGEETEFEASNPVTVTTTTTTAPVRPPAPEPTQVNDNGEINDAELQAFLDEMEDAEDDSGGSIWGAILILIGFLAIVVGRIWLLLVAFREGCLWAAGVLLIDIVALIFAIQHWDEARNPFLVSVAGIILVIIGVFAGAV